MTWRLISHLSLNYLTLTDLDAEQGATALRELLELYADLADVDVRGALRGRSQGVRRVAVAPRTRRASRARAARVRARTGDPAHPRRDRVRGRRARSCSARCSSSSSGASRPSTRSPSSCWCRETRGEIERWPPRMAVAAARAALFAALGARRRGRSTSSRRCAGSRRVSRPSGPGWARRCARADEPCACRQEPSLAFAPSPLSAFEEQGERLPPRLEQRFFGLLGPNGPLPLHLTEYARERVLHHDDARSSRFLDLFHHRLTLLFYRAWADAQPAVQHDRPDDDRFAAYVGRRSPASATPARAAATPWPTTPSCSSSGTWRESAQNAEGLACDPGGFFRRRCGSSSSCSAGSRCRREQRTMPGRRAADAEQLGRRRGRRRARPRRRRAGSGSCWVPWTSTGTRFLPGGRSLTQLRGLVRNYIGFELAWDVRLVLRRDEVPGHPARPRRAARVDDVARRPARATTMPTT